MTIEHQRWVKENGEQKRLSYPEVRTYVDLGGFDGVFAEKVINKYNCKSFIFEPVPKFYEMCKSRFSGNESVVVSKLGLGKEKGTFFVEDTNDATHLTSSGDIEVQVEDVAEAFKQFPELIDLMKINIEGAEYEVLERLIECDLISRINNIQIQFHRFDYIDRPIERRNKIIDHLKNTHMCEWNYEFVWESWKLK